MSVNRGKQFEDIIRRAFEKVPGVSIDRIHDQTNFYKGSQNICDFIVYKEPHEYYIECKSVHGASLPFRNITDTQWDGLLEKSKIEGVYAGIICWFIDKDVTKFIPIRLLDYMRKFDGVKSYPYQFGGYLLDGGKGNEMFAIELKGNKKRVFFNYDMEEFFNEIQSDR